MISIWSLCNKQICIFTELLPVLAPFPIGIIEEICSTVFANNL